MRDLNQTEHKIVNLLVQGKCPKRYSRSVTYIIWNGAVESRQPQKEIQCSQHS